MIISDEEWFKRFAWIHMLYVKPIKRRIKLKLGDKSDEGENTKNGRATE